MGLSWDDVTAAAGKFLPQAQQYIQKAGTALSAGTAVLDDPYFPEVTCHVLRLQAINKGQRPGVVCPSTVSTPAADRKGIGLRYAAKPLRAVVYAREKPWIVPVVVAAIIGVPFVLGMVIGKGVR